MQFSVAVEDLRISDIKMRFFSPCYMSMAVMYLYPRERCNSKWGTGQQHRLLVSNCCAGEISAFQTLGAMRGTSNPSAQGCNVLSLFSDLLAFTPVVKNTNVEIGKAAVSVSATGCHWNTKEVADMIEQGWKPC